MDISSLDDYVAFTLEGALRQRTTGTSGQFCTDRITQGAKLS